MITSALVGVSNIIATTDINERIQKLIRVVRRLYLFYGFLILLVGKIELTSTLKAQKPLVVAVVVVGLVHWLRVGEFLTNVKV